MKRIFISVLTMLSAWSSLFASDTLKVQSFRQIGPIELLSPVIIDSTDVNGKSFNLAEYAMEEDLDLKAVSKANFSSSLNNGAGLYLASFSASTTNYAHATLEVKGLDGHCVYLDGKKASGELKLEPGTHEFIVKYYIPENDSTKCETSINLISEAALKLETDGRKIYSLDINTDGPSVHSVSLSPSGKYAVISSSRVFAGGKSARLNELVRLSDSKVLVRSADAINWMPLRDEYYTTPTLGTGERKLISTNPESGVETVLCENLPEGYFIISPNEDFLIFTKMEEGPKEGDVHQILTPDDRQPGWRDRSYISKYDLRSGTMQRLTFGYHSTYLADISQDGSKLLYMITDERLTSRPTSLISVFELDLRSLESRKVIDRDGFISNVQYSPDASKILVTGSSEAFGGVGMDLPEGRIPNEFDYQLFVLDCASLEVKSITRDFNPCVQDSEWSVFDGKIYTVVEDKDCKILYRIDPVTCKAEKLPAKEEYVRGFSLAKKSGVLGYAGQSLCNGDRAYVLELKKGRNTLLKDSSAERLEGVDICEGRAFEFTSSRGDEINCFVVLPQDFDPSKKYPMLVHYYGGCSPSTRYMVGSYSPHYYAAQGYVFLVVNPSGASGFGQEFASRHVNTAGEGVAEDIIEAVERFCDENSFVNRDKIGCFSASYGGFMTQLLLIKSDIFAAGISHAGISDHSSYWGEGYWGYNYSEVSMANSYPWTRKDLYVDRSPLYNADKIHTPLLFLHGSADTNVPIGESIQMFTALKLLGEETAFVVVDGENHGISEYGKRRDWLRTISAWFARYLKDDSLWWNDMYPNNYLVTNSSFASY